MLDSFIKRINILQITFLSFVLRFLGLIFYKNQNLPDTATYERVGQEVFSGNIIQTPIHMPGYGIWMFILNYITQNNYGVIFGDIIISCLTVYVIYLLSIELFKSEIIAKIGAIIFAIYPFSIFYSFNAVSETLFIFFLYTSILMFYRRKFLYAYFLIILSIYVKPTSDIFAPFLILIFCFLIYRYSAVKTLRQLFIFYFLYSLLLSPWWVHNWNKYDNFVRLNLSMGYHLYSGNNPLNKSGGGIGGVDVNHGWTRDDMRERPLEFDKKFKKDAFNFIKENPKKFIKLSIIKFKRFWQIYPYAEEYKGIFYKILSIFSYGLVLIFSILFLTSSLKKFLIKISPLITIILLTTAIHCLTIASIRYRFPIEPILIVFASYYLYNQFKKFKLLK